MDVKMLLDGGTLKLQVLDENGKRHAVSLSQRAFLENPDAGVLRCNGLGVPLRSDREAELLALLRAADVGTASEVPPPPPHRTIILGDDIKSFVTRSPAANLRATRDEIVAFVESEEYVSLRQRLARAQEIKE